MLTKYTGISLRIFFHERYASWTFRFTSHLIFYGPPTFEIGSFFFSRKNVAIAHLDLVAFFYMATKYLNLRAIYKSKTKLQAF